MHYASNLKVLSKRNTTQNRKYITKTKYDMPVLERPCQREIQHKTQNQDKIVIQYAPNIKVLSTPIPLAIVAKHKDRKQRWIQRQIKPNYTKHKFKTKYWDRLPLEDPCQCQPQLLWKLFGENILECVSLLRVILEFLSSQSN